MTELEPNRDLFSDHFHSSIHPSIHPSFLHGALVTVGSPWPMTPVTAHQFTVLCTQLVLYAECTIGNLDAPKVPTGSLPGNGSKTVTLNPLSSSNSTDFDFYEFKLDLCSFSPSLLETETTPFIFLLV